MAMNPDPTAVMGRRVGAVAIDGAITFVPAFAILVSSLEEVRVTGDADRYCTNYMEDQGGFCFSDGSSAYRTDDGLVTAGIALYGLAILLHVVLQGLTGWTVGKLATGIRVVQPDGTRAPFWRVLVRWLLWIVDGLPGFGLVGLITGATTVGHRRVGDMVAKTYVVRKDAVGHPVVLPGQQGSEFTPPPGALPHNAGMPFPTAKTGPQWDESRGTYIQWDPEASAWMQWDDTAKRWDPIQVQQPVIPPPPPPPPPTIDAPPPPPL